MEENKAQNLLDRTLRFNVSVLNRLNELPYNPIFLSTYQQLSRSSGSIGANYQEAQGAASARDFHYKIGIVFRECRETNHWIKVVQQLHPKSSFVDLQQESLELTKIFKTIHNKTNPGPK